MVTKSEQLDRSTKQHTQFGVSASNGSRDMGRRKSWRKKKEKRKMNMAKTIENPLRGSLIIKTRQVLGRPVCNRGAIPRR